MPTDLTGERVPQPINVDLDRDADPADRAASELEWIKASTVSTANLALTPEQARTLVAKLPAVFDQYLEIYRGKPVDRSRPFQIQSKVIGMTYDVRNGSRAPRGAVSRSKPRR